MPRFQKQPSTNTEFVTELMEFSPYGGLVQAFIIQGIQDYAKRVLANPIPTEGRSKQFINPDAWEGIAKDITAKIDAYFGSQK